MKREIRFSEEDFDPILKSVGLDPESITEYEWSKFGNMFCDGTHWYEVAEIAADQIAYNREMERKGII